MRVWASRCMHWWVFVYGYPGVCGCIWLDWSMGVGVGVGVLVCMRVCMYVWVVCVCWWMWV